jgi:preprotein translocase subunit SecE
MSSLNPAKFIREVRQEMRRVTWPSRKETWVSTVMVLGLVTLASLFFVVVDLVIGSTVRFIIGV